MMRMSSLTLEIGNRAQAAELLSGDDWIVACLCAAWCDVCRQFQPRFDALAAAHPDKRFLWIDIEDQADVVGELDVENFPTVLMQRGDSVAFYGTVLPDPNQLNRLLAAQAAKSAEDVAAEARGSSERASWQRDCNLRLLLQQALNG